LLQLGEYAAASMGVFYSDFFILLDVQLILFIYFFLTKIEIREMPSDVWVFCHMVYDPAAEINTLASYYYPSYAFNIIAVLLLLFLVLSELNDFAQERWGYLNNIGNIYDAIIVTCVVLMVVYEFSADKAVKHMFPISLDDWNNSTKHYPLLSIMYETEDLTKILGIVAILIWIRVLQYTVYLPVFGPLVRSLANTLKDPSVIAFTMLLLFVLMAFTLGIRTCVSFLEVTQEYRSAFVMLFTLMMGQFPDNDFVNTLTSFGILLFLLFVLIMSVILVNMFISVLSVVRCSISIHPSLQAFFFFFGHIFNAIQINIIYCSFQFQSFVVLMLIFLFLFLFLFYFEIHIVAYVS
jgi:hypothetical protein